MSDESINTLREALEISPENVPLRLHLAEILIRSNHIAEAEEECKHALKYDAGNRRAKLLLATVYYSRKELSTAIVILEELIQQNPKAVDCLLLISRALLEDGAKIQAAEYYRRALDINPSAIDEELDDKLRLPAYQGSMDFDDDYDEDDEEDLDEFFEKPDINFDDVGGLDDVKQEIDLKIIKPLQFADIYHAYGKKTGGGILLYGPPGCGKTHIARATAGQIDARFMNITIDEVLDMWIGNSEKNLHELFEVARENTPCVMFFDEVDALGASRSDMRQSAGRHLINQFLSELDGVEKNNDGLLILGATNAPWHLDPAFRRPGRFDRIIFVAPPDLEGRKAILKLVLKGKPMGKIDYDGIAKKTEGFSGADLTSLVDLAIEDKLEMSFKTGKPLPLETDDLLKAVKKQRPTTTEWFNTAKNYALYANDSGLYDDILTYLNIKK
ncbi:MAG: AAA family ATPase [Cyclobacteriaceae bacterium]